MKKVLIIDDEEDFCYFLKKNLEGRGEYKVTFCTSGRQAFNVILKELPDIVLIDILLPDLSGSEIAEKMRGDARTSKIPFIFLTAVIVEDDIKVRGDVIGGNFFIAKPVKIERIVEVITEALA